MTVSVNFFQFIVYKISFPVSLNPRFRCAAPDRSDQTLYQTFLSYQMIVRPKALWSDRSAHQEIVRPGATQIPLIRLSCDPNISCDSGATQILSDFSATNAPSDQTIPEYML